MVSWKISNISCVIEILLLPSIVIWILTAISEHFWIALIHVTKVLLTIVIHLLWHLTAQKVWVDLLIWVNTVLLLIHLLLLLSHHLLLGLFIHSRVHTSHTSFVHARLLLYLLLAIVLGWGFFGWWLVSWWLVVSFSVHSCKLK